MSAPLMRDHFVASGLFQLISNEVVEHDLRLYRGKFDSVRKLFVL